MVSKQRRHSRDLKAQFDKAIALHQQGRVSDARAIYVKLIKRDPANAALLNLCGLAEFQGNRPDDALKRLRQAVARDPQNAKYHYDLGVVLQSTGRHSKSAEHYEQVVRIDPAALAAWENLGVARFDSGAVEPAVSAFERALELNPGSVLSLSNLATLRRWQGRHDIALQLLDRALALDPLNAELRSKRAEALLAAGEWQDGWKEYAWRFLLAGSAGNDQVHRVMLPKWTGQPLMDRHVLVHREQGIGDEIMFASCLPDLSEMGARISLLCDRRLTSLFARSFPDISVVGDVPGDWGEAGEAVHADWRIPIGDLPGVFRTAAQDFRGAAYLIADPGRCEVWRCRLRDLGDGPKVGLSWRGGRNARAREARSVALGRLEPLFSRPDVCFVNLQYGDIDDDLRVAPDGVGKRLHCFADVNPLTELDDFCALIASLDLVISIDNSTVHFAGALGVPTWLLAPTLTDWRWPASGDRSAWYDSLRLVRPQPGSPDPWSSVIEDAAIRLAVFQPAPRNVRPANVSNAVRPIPDAHSIDATRGRALLLNDTSYWYHYGCTCTSLALRNELKKAGWQVKGVPVDSLTSLSLLPEQTDQFESRDHFQRFERRHKDLCAALAATDTVVINGEGSLHDLSPLALALLYLAQIAAVRYERPVHVINHSCFPDTGPGGQQAQHIYERVYAGLASVAIREPVSADLIAASGVEVTRSFDCLPLFVAAHADQISREPHNRLLIAGSAAVRPELLATLHELLDFCADSGIEVGLLFGANAHAAADERVFAQQLFTGRENVPRLIFARSAIDWLSAIASSAVLVSGRFHHSIAAACVGTPFVVMDSNTPKIDGLMRLLGLESRVNIDPSTDIGELTRCVAAVLRGELSATISAEKMAFLRAAALRNFTALGAKNDEI